MQTIRGRLAVSYAIAMIATLGAFAAALYLSERPVSYQQVDARMQAEADLINAILEEAYRSRDSLVFADPLDQGMSLDREVATLLETVPDYLLVLGLEEPVFISGNTRTALAQEPFAVFETAARGLIREGGTGLVDLGDPNGRVRFVVRPITNAGDHIAAVVAGVSTMGLVLRPQRLLSAMLLIAPFVILASTAIAYALAGRTLQPVDNIVDEVEAITDGRSLHKRLAQPTTEDELSRLISTLNAMFNRLETSFRALRRFTADASHELKTPLTVLRSGIERAITHPQVSPEVLEVLEETLLEVKRMTELVDSLLTLARADEGRAPLHVEQVDLRDLMNETAETAGILGEQASVSVSVAAPRRSQILSVDRNRMRQLLMNLLTNAIKYTPAGGKVTFDASVREGNVVFTVSDTGIGIAPGEMPHVFNRFWRADPARSRTGQRSGAGLGLAISKWIAEAHGGSIQINSRAGKGTTMIVTVPLSLDQDQ